MDDYMLILEQRIYECEVDPFKCKNFEQFYKSVRGKIGRIKRAYYYNFEEMMYGIWENVER